MHKIKIISTAILALVIIAIVPMFMGSFSEEAIRWAVRRTADIAFILFYFSFGASALHLLTKSKFSTWLVQNRRYLGISFGIAFLTHGMLILFLAQRYPEPLLTDLTNTTIYIGIIAFSFTALMTLTSNNSAVKLLGRKLWSTLHTMGGYYLVTVFTLTYLSKLENIYFWPYALMAVSLLLLRFYKVIKSFMHRSNTKNQTT